MLIGRETERMMRNKKKRIKRLLAAVLCLITVFSQLFGTAPWNSVFVVRAAEASSPIALRRIDGSGEAFIYHSFVETTAFTTAQTYAFLNGIYGDADAVSSLGAGAILKATATNNNSSRYIKNKYGTSAAVKVYVDVITPGKDFDHCVVGGLYEVPNSGTPTEYRYFCGFGGAQNCGPYYAYHYEKESVTSGDVSASLKDIEKQGSENSEDYTVTITYDGNKSKVLDPGSYTVDFTAPDTATFVVSDSEGNSITANFQSPLAVRYDGNSEKASNVPSVQAVWRGESSKIFSQKPTRTGYSFINWKNAETDAAYSAGQSFTPAKSMQLLAQWKDSQKPNVGYTPTQVMTGDSDETVKNAVKAALTVTDNEPVSECTITVTVPSDFTKTPGNKNVTVTVKDKAGNTTTKTCSVYVSSYVDISTPVFTADTKNLTSTLNNPGTDAVTESGFVWGVMNTPSLTVNNGKAKTTTTASKAGDKISVTADNLQKGVTYYARAYITAGGVTYYSEEITIGLGLPAYGTFTIKNNGNNTFTVTRSGGSEGTQTVYFRTVNGSAVGGTHFTHQNGTLTFNAGETTKTITITETNANTAYTGKPATAYSNADRTYSAEIYRVMGGGTLGSTTSATRTLINGSGYTVDRSIYTTEEAKSHNVGGGDSYDNRWVADHSGTGDGNLYWRNDRGYNKTYNYDNFNANSSIDDRYSKVDYIKGTADSYLYRYDMKAYEEEDGWEHAWMGTHEPNNAHSYTKCGSSYTGSPISLDDSVAGSAVWTAVFQIAEGYSVTKHFPTMTGGGGEDKGSLSNTVTKFNNNGSVASVDGTTYAKIPIADTVYNFFAATGANKDKWYVESFTDYTKIYDTVEPRLVAVAPMAGGTYKVGDSFTVSLIFDEIVDSTNSGTLSNIVANTSWGTASYVGGANTNVLYFKGTVASNASTTLSVNGFTNPSYIKDMCSASSTQTASGSGNTTATVDTSIPNFTVTANGITNGTGKATIKINADQTKTTGMSYVWSDSTTAPTTGWVELSSTELTTAKGSSGLPLSIRKESGSGASNGKWYLHVKAVYDTTGASVYKNTCLDFGTAASPTAGSTPPTLIVTADNTNWATSRSISISAKGAEKLQYRKPGATSWTTLSSTATSVTVQENGYYTFLLTAGDVAIFKTVQVEKIDLEKPTASIGELTSDSTESPKSGVYTKLVLPITYADAQSGVKNVYYNWTNSTTTPTSWINTLRAGATTVTYTATENASTKKYLHIKVYDNLNHTYTTYSSAYTVISQTAVDNHTPTITITGAPTEWTNDMATLTWQLSNYSGKNYEVILPDGKTSTESSGQVWARQNGNYTVTVRDLDYGGENSATIEVDKLDFAPPTVTVSGGSSSWTNANQTFTITAVDSQSGVGDIWYKIVSTTEESPTEGLKKLTGSTITVSDEGKHYVYYKVYDKAGDTETGREANKTDGFTKLVQIDKTAPEITFGDYSAASGITVNVKDGKGGAISSGLASVTYKIGDGKETPISEDLSGSPKTNINFTLTELPAGDTRITVTAVDNVGKRSVSYRDIHVDIVSVDITWGAMEFTYSDGTWNAETHTYEGGGWMPDETDGNRITTHNNGNVAVSVSYRYTKTNSTVSGGFTDGQVPITAPVALPVGGTKSVWLILNGKPTETLEKAVLGSVTVTVGGD